MPFFLSARRLQERLKAAPISDQAEEQSNPDSGDEMSLDSAYLARKNAQLIANQGAHPYIVLKSNTASSLSLATLHVTACS
ncbi:MAG: hypothetical protein QXQ39_07150 [Conexivisphaerales archaeon]